MERKQEGRRKVKREKGNGRRNAEAEAENDNAMTLSVVEEANAFSAGDNGACSNGRSGENKCGGSEGVRTGCGSSS